jgi:EAL domain-containing protein (putative c-di-GMP-specific phosphodiesterase class I)
VEPYRVVFEITETSAISNFDQTKQMVERLRAIGCRFALDDFGAGFNSYSYLKHFPVDILKIDGGFITNLVNDPVDQLLVKSMIDIAHSLGKKTVAEFVEEQVTMDLLKSYGVDYVQGYLVGKPQSALPKKR